jgi:hypothetical protein
MLLPALPALRAQARGFSFTPVIGYMWPTPIFEHTVDFPTAEGFPPNTERQRLRVHPALVLGGRFGFALTPGWKLYAEGTSAGTTTMDYIDLVENGTGVFSGSTAGRSATFETVELGAERLFHLATRLPTIGVKLGAGSYRFAIQGNPLLCLSPIATPQEACPWVNHYNITSAVAECSTEEQPARSPKPVRPKAPSR